MKTALDKKIITGLILIATVALITGLIIDIELTALVVGAIFSIGYFLFLMCHIAMGYPSIIIAFIVGDILDKPFTRIKRHSVILAHIFRVPIVTVTIIGIHLLWLYIAITLTTYDYTLDNFGVILTEISKY
jgi:hypothetical protein